MASTFTVECTHCSASLKVRNASHIGKKVRCPRCEKAFIIEAPTVDSDEVEDGGFFDEYDQFASQTYDNFYEDDDVYEDYQPKPKKSKRKSSSSKKRKRRRKKKVDRSLGAILGISLASVALLALLGTGIFYGLSFLSFSDADRFAWLPNDMETYVEFRPAEIWNADVMRPIRQTEFAVEFKDKLSQQIGLEIDKIEKIVVGTPATGKDSTVIVYASEPFDLASVTKEAQAVSYAGKTFYDKGKQVAFFVNDRVMVIGSRIAVEAAIDRNGACAAAEEFASLPASGDLIFGTTVGDNILSVANNPMMRQKPNVDPKTVQSSALVLNLGRDLLINFEVNFDDAESAKEAVTEAQSQLEELKAKLEDQKKELQNMEFVLSIQARAMLFKVSEMLSTIDFGSWGNQFYGDMKISAALVRDVSEGIEYIIPPHVLEFGNVLGHDDDEEFPDFDDADMDFEDGF